MSRFKSDVLQRLGFGRSRPSDALTDRILSIAEPITLFATVVAFALTLGGLNAGFATEANPVAAELFATIGYAGTGVLAIGALIGAFRLFAFWKRIVPTTVSLGAIVVALVSLGDAGRNLFLVLASDSDAPIVPSAVAGAVAIVALVAAVWVLRRPLGELAAGVPTPSRRQTRALLFAFVMVSSVVAMPLIFTGTLSGGNSGVVSAQSADSCFEESVKFGINSNSIECTNQRTYDSNQSLKLPAIDSDWNGIATQHSIDNPVGEPDLSTTLYHDSDSSNAGPGFLVYYQDADNFGMVHFDRIDSGRDNLVEVNYGEVTNGEYNLIASDMADTATRDDYSNQWVNFDAAIQKTGSGIEINAESEIAGSNELHETYNIEVSESDLSFEEGGVGFAKQNVGTVGGNTYYDIGKSNLRSSELLSGTVEDQEGNPVSNATVSAWGTNPSNFDESQLEDLNGTIDDLESQLNDPLPDEFNESLELTGSGGYLADAETNVVTVHSESQWDLNGRSIPESGIEYGIDPNLEQPKVTAPAGERVVLSVRDPTETGGFITDREDSIDDALPGRTTSGTIVVEQLSPTGGVTDTRELETEPIVTANPSFSFATKTHEAAVTELPAGVYRVYPEGHEETAYAVTVGEPSELVDTFTADIESQLVTLDGQQEQLSELLADDRIVRKTVQTDENGRFSVDMPANVRTAQVTALRADGSVLQGIEDPGLEDLREAQLNDYNGSFYLPSPQPNSVEPPAENITVDVYRSPEVPLGDLQSFADLQEFLEGERLNETVSELRTEYEKRFEDMERSSLERVYQNHRVLVETIPNAEARYVDRSEFDRVQDAENLTKTELETETRKMQLTIANSGTIDTPELPENPDDPLEIVDGLVNGERPLPPGVDEDSVSVELHTSTGDVETIDEEYWSVESSGLFGSDSVVVDEYPIENDGAAAYTIRVQGANNDGRLDDRIPVSNPGFNGMVPEIDAVDFSTLAPGDGERVSVGVDPADGSGYDQLVSADAYGPDGAALNATIDESRDRASFTTDGTGEHYVRLTFESDSGDRFTIAERVRALEQPRSDPATIRTSQSALGTHAVVGEQLESARVETDRGTTEFTAVAPGDDSISSLAIKPGETVKTASHTFEIAVVEGSDETTTDSHVSVAVHMDRYSEETIAWRNGEPIVQSGGTRWGEVQRPDDDAEKGVLRTYTDADGQATIELNSDPDRLDRLSHWIAYSVPTPSIPFLSIFGSGSALIAGIAVAFTRRRRVS